MVEDALRPITLCNVLYKIIANVLVNWLKHILPSVISEAHSSFIPNKPITNNIMIAFEIYHFPKRKKQSKIRETTLKINMSKAYDQI